MTMTATATKADESLAEGHDYHMPRPTIGQVVYYYADCNYGVPVPAVVLDVGDHTVNLGAIVKDSMSVHPVPHARHRSDPALLRGNTSEDGAWEFTPLERGHQAALAELRGQIAGLRLKLGKVKKDEPAEEVKA